MIYDIELCNMTEQKCLLEAVFMLDSTHCMTVYFSNFLHCFISRSVPALGSPVTYGGCFLPSSGEAVVNTCNGYWLSNLLFLLLSYVHSGRHTPLLEFM